MPKEHEYRWLALEATKAFNIHKTTCLANKIEPMPVEKFMREFTSDYIIATLEIPSSVKNYLDDCGFGEKEKDIKL